MASLEELSNKVRSICKDLETQLKSDTLEGGFNKTLWAIIATIKDVDSDINELSRSDSVPLIQFVSKYVKPWKEIKSKLLELKFKLEKLSKLYKSRRDKALSLDNILKRVQEVREDFRKCGMEHLVDSTLNNIVEFARKVINNFRNNFSKVIGQKDFFSLYFELSSDRYENITANEVGEMLCGYTLDDIKRLGFSILYRYAMDMENPMDERFTNMDIRSLQDSVEDLFYNARWALLNIRGDVLSVMNTLSELCELVENYPKG